MPCPGQHFTFEGGRFSFVLKRLKEKYIFHFAEGARNVSPKVEWKIFAYIEAPAPGGKFGCCMTLPPRTVSGV